MSYAVRNTIILLVTLFIIAGGAFSYIKFFQEAELDRLESEHTELQQDFNSKKAISDAFPEMNKRYQEAQAVINSYNKSLFKSNNPDDVYDYLNLVSSSSSTSQIFFDYTFNDSTSHDQYGIIRSTVQGYASYTNFLNFLNKIENSQLLNKVSGLSLSPPGGEDLSDITFNFSLDSYYERIPLQEASGGEGLKMGQLSTYNPFYPLILSSLPANENNLINVERSRIIGLTGSRIFIIDQNGEVKSLRKGDEVYLGHLQDIDLNAKTATFNLNKGGITELVTLEIEK